MTRDALAARLRQVANERERAGYTTAGYATTSCSTATHTTQGQSTRKESNMETMGPAAPPQTLDLNSGDLTHYRLAIQVMVDTLNKGPKSRARSLMVTKLEEASMWANEAMRTD